MASYKENILEVIGESEVGLTTVDVAKKAGVSKTTVIKYLSVLSSEGKVEFVEVGPSKLWRKKGQALKHGEEGGPLPKAEAYPDFEIDLGGEDGSVRLSFRVDPERLCALMKKADLCQHEKTSADILVEG